MTDDQVQTFADTMELKNKSQKVDIVLMIKK